MEEKIYEILKEIRPEFDFTQSENFIDDGFLDSFDVVTIISELENQFNIVIDGLDVVPENFETVQTIAELVNRSEKKN